MEINTKELEIFLIKKLEDEVLDDWSGGSFTESAPASGKIEVELLDKWLKIEALIRYTGSTMDQSTDRASGDPEDVHAWYDWIGLAETAPTKVSLPDELNKWAHITTYYRVTFRDVQYPAPFGFHEGRRVKTFTPDGKGELHVVTERRFQDVSPNSMCKVEPFDLNEIKKS